jgi:uncharacterized protein (TIGR03086 family)
MSAVDLQPAADQMRALVRAARAGALADPTPCAEYTVADLLDHIAFLTVGFTEAARKSGTPSSTPPPPGDGARLHPDWHDEIPRRLDELVLAWREPGARDGMTSAGGIEMPAEIAGTVAVEELVVHAWDLARATGQPYAIDDDSARAVIDFVSQFAGPDQAELRGNAYADPVPTGAGAPLLDRAIALTGRDPGWSKPEPRA